MAHLLWIGGIRKNPSWRMEAHTHSYPEVICFHGGRGAVSVREKTYFPRAGSVLVYRPGETHEERSDPLFPQETVFFGFDNRGSLGDVATHLWDGTGDIRWLSRALLREVRSNPHGYASPLAKLYLAALLHWLKRLGDASDSQEVDWVAEAKRYIDAHYHDPQLDRQTIARAVGVSVSTLTGGFVQRYAISPISYVQKVRIENAAQMIRASDLLMREIAHSVGFSDPYYFSRTFRKHFGCSPMNYRKRHDENP